MINLKDIFVKFENNNPSYDFFIEKGFSQDIIDKFHICQTNNYLNDDVFKDLFPNESELFYNGYSYIIPGYDINNNLDYLMIRRRGDFNKKTSPIYLHKTLFLGDIDRGIGKIYNGHHLLDDNKFVFIVETWTDALSLEEIGYAAIGMNRVINCNGVLKDLIKDNINKVKDKTFIVMCDSDEIGIQADKDIYNMLKEQDINAVVSNYYPTGIKDANEWLVANKKEFIDYINTFIKEIK